MTDLTIHIKIHDGRDPQCDTCANTFRQDAALGIQEHTHGPGSTQTNQVEAKPSNNNVTKESEEEPPVVETSNKSDNDRLSREYGSEN